MTRECCQRGIPRGVIGSPSMTIGTAACAPWSSTMWSMDARSFPGPVTAIALRWGTSSSSLLMSLLPLILSNIFLLLSILLLRVFYWKAEYILNLYSILRRQYPSSCPGGVGIITAYNAQKHLLKKLFKQQYGFSMGGSSSKKDGPGCDVEISTIDGFQGREKDVIIFSCVRSSSQVIQRTAYIHHLIHHCYSLLLLSDSLDVNYYLSGSI